MFVAFRRKHPAFFRLADESKPDEIGLKHFNTLPRQSHLRGDDIETHSTFPFTENLKVTLLDEIQTEAVNLFNPAHSLDVTRRDEVRPRSRCLTLRRFQ